MSDRPTREEYPHDRLTRLCDAAIKGIEAHPEYVEDEIKVIVMIHARGRGGIGLHGYGTHAGVRPEVESATDMLVHLKAIFEAAGKTLILAPIDGPGRG